MPFRHHESYEVRKVVLIKSEDTFVITIYTIVDNINNNEDLRTRQDICIVNTDHTGHSSKDVSSADIWTYCMMKLQTLIQR